MNIWYADRTSGGWTEAAHFESPVINQTVHAASVTADGSIYATGLIRLRRSGEQYLPAERLRPDVRGSHPAVAADENFVVYTGRHTGGFGGSDLFIIFQKSDGTWTDPVNPGSRVNSNRSESSPTLSSDGRFLFFSRDGNIWWASTDVIKAVRPDYE